MKSINYKICLKSAPQTVFDKLTTDSGRSSFWAEKSSQVNTIIHFEFPNGFILKANVVETSYPTRFKITYFGTNVLFLISEVNEETILELINTEVPDHEYNDMCAGWVSVLMNLKSVVDFNIDLRNHNQVKTWDAGFVDN